MVLNPAPSDITPLLAKITAELGQDWLSTHDAHHIGRELPLVQWIRLTQEAADADRPRIEAAQHLARLAHSLHVLRAAGTFGIEERAGSLRETNEDKFYSTVQELITASHYVLHGHSVAFVPEAEDRRPDILIDDGIEVECKLKARDTPVDRRRYELYQYLHRRMRRALEASEDTAGITVEVAFGSEPTRGSVDEVAALVSQAIRPDGPFYFNRTHGDVRYRIAARRVNSTRGNLIVSIPASMVDEYDWITLRGATTLDERGLPTTRNASTFAAKCDVLQDRVKSLQNSLRSAAGQFSGDRPAIVHVDVTSSLSELVGDHLPRSTAVLESFMRNNHTISAVLLEHDHYRRSSEAVSLYRTVEYLWNSEARHPVPQELHEQLSQPTS